MGKEKGMESSKKAILIIDDDVNILRTFSRILQKNGYSTDTAGTGKEAIEKAEKQHYAAALIDVCLPDLNGITLTSKLQQLNNKMIKIIITGFPMKAPKNEADAFLIKPVKPEKLLDTLKEKLKF
jgi:DNA-binding NtrC family response regulator